jgi:hypothetical protein
MREEYDFSKAPRAYEVPHVAKPQAETGNIADALAMPGIADIGFEPPCVNVGARPADFS